MHSAEMLDKLIVVLLTAVIVVPVFQRLKLSSVLGYLAAGAVIGPHGLGLIGTAEGTTLLAEFGVVFLLFTIGLELSLERLRAMRRHIFGLGAAQVGVSALVIGGIALALGQPLEVAVIIGAALALSSTAVVLQVLSEQRDLIARIGRISFAVLLFQDLAVAPILALVPLLGDGNSGSVLLLMAMAVVKGIVAIAAIFLAGNLLLQPIFRAVAATANREMFVGLVLLVALGTGWATQQVGLSMALGAFLAGLVLAGSEFRHQVEADISPFRGILLGFFFMTVGMMVNPELLIDQALPVLGLVAGLLAVKAAILFAVAQAFRLSLPMSVRLAMILAQGGEFAFVILGLAMDEGIMPADTGQTLIVVVAISMALTPFLAMLAKRSSRAVAAVLEQREESRLEALAGEAADLSDHVVVAGFGRVGQTVARVLAAQGVPHLALDLDPGRVSKARAAGSQVFYGDASHPEVLRAAGVGNARAVVITIDQPRTAERIAHMLRAEHPELTILARARDRSNSTRLEAAGATLAVPETLESSLQLGSAMLMMLGRRQDEVARMVSEFRSGDYEALAEIVPASPPSSADRDTAA